MLLSELVERVGFLLQDTNHQAWTENNKLTQILDEIDKLSRKNLFGEIVWFKGVTAQHIYTLADTVVDVMAAFYDGRTLRESTERSLALKDPSWEQKAQRPQYYTSELMTQSQVAIVPAPLVTGSDIPELPPLPLAWKIQDNIVIFTTDNPQTSEELSQQCMVPDWIEDIVVYRAAAKIAGQKGDYQDEEKSYMLDGIANIFYSALSEDLDIEAKV